MIRARIKGKGNLEGLVDVDLSDMPTSKVCVVGEDPELETDLPLYEANGEIVRIVIPEMFGLHAKISCTDEDERKYFWTQLNDEGTKLFRCDEERLSETKGNAPRAIPCRTINIDKNETERLYGNDTLNIGWDIHQCLSLNVYIWNDVNYKPAEPQETFEFSDCEEDYMITGGKELSEVVINLADMKNLEGIPVGRDPEAEFKKTEWLQYRKDGEPVVIKTPNKGHFSTLAGAIIRKNNFYDEPVFFWREYDQGTVIELPGEYAMKLRKGMQFLIEENARIAVAGDPELELTYKCVKD
jgi:hypothetical protein